MAGEANELKETITQLKGELDTVFYEYERGELQAAWIILRHVKLVVEDEFSDLTDMLFDEHIRQAVKDNWKEP